MKPKPEPPCFCPTCGKNLTHATAVSEDQIDHFQPEPGDLSMCIECGECLEFDDDMMLRKVKLEDQSEEHIKIFTEARHRIKERQYFKQLEKMRERAGAWRKANPHREAMIVFPAQIMVIGAISEAIKRGMVKTNEAGLELLKALWDWDAKDEPTVLMCRVALEAKP